MLMLVTLDDISVTKRPLTVGLQVFAFVDQGIDWSVICAAALMTSAPLILAFLLFQQAFIQSFLRAVAEVASLSNFGNLDQVQLTKTG